MSSDNCPLCNVNHLEYASLNSQLSQLRSELERVKVERDAENLRAKQALNLVGELRTEVERLAFSCMEREGQRDAAESKLTASESARRVLVEEIVAARLDFNAQQSTCDQIKLMAASQRLDAARAAVDSLKLLEGEG